MRETPSPYATPDLADLRAFCAVVDLGSLTAAAKKLGQTKGAISRRLTRLEATLGVTLLSRSARRVLPTEEGAAYRAQAGSALEQLDEATCAVRQERARPRGTLRVTVLQDFASLLLAPLLPAFLQRYPEISLELLTTDQVLDFDEHQLDVALRASGALKDSSLIARKLFVLRLMLVAAPSYLARAGHPGSVEELYQHQLLLFRQPGRLRPFTLHRNAEDKAGTPLHAPGRVIASEGGVLRALALAGGGIAILPSPLVAPDLAAGALVPAMPGYTVGSPGDFYFIHRQMPFLPPKLRVFRDYLSEVLEERPPRPRT